MPGRQRGRARHLRRLSLPLRLVLPCCLLILTLPMAGCGGASAADDRRAEAGTDAGQPEAGTDAGQPETDADVRQTEADTDTNASQPQTDTDAGQSQTKSDAGQAGSGAAVAVGEKGTAGPSDTENGPAPTAPEGISPVPETGAASFSFLPSPSTAGALKVCGTNLCAADGTPVQLRGISTHGLAWFPDYVNEACFRDFRQNRHMNVVRLALYTAEYGGYCEGGDRERLKTLVRNGIDYAKAQDLYVIVDWHILSDSDPNIHLADAKEFFAEISAEYCDADHILYEICNEPNGGTGWEQIGSYAREVIPVIREHDADAVILVGTPNWSQYVDQAAASPLTEYDNVMYTLHFYAATHREDLRERLKSAVDAGLPVFVSEYGICDASGNGAIDEAQADAWVELLDAYQISYVAWNLSNKNETSAILAEGCQKTSGFTEEDLSASGRWLYRMLEEHSEDGR